MTLFKIAQKKVHPLRRKEFKKEKELQEISETNLEKIFGLQFVATEFQLKNLRIDTLSFDQETNSFVIIEYKRSRSFSIIDQGFAYLSLMFNNKAAFILEYNEKNKKNLSRGDVDWSQSRILFIANRFTTHQQKAINFKDLPLELWEVQRYENNLVNYEKLKTPGANASIKDLSVNQTISKVSKEVKQYTVEDHLKADWKNSRELFEQLRERILNLDDRLVENVVKSYIGYKIDNSVVVALIIQKSKIILELYRVEPHDLKDPENAVYYRKNSYQYYSKHITRFNISETEDIEYALFLIKQIYRKFFKD